VRPFGFLATPRVTRDSFVCSAIPANLGKARESVVSPQSLAYGTNLVDPASSHMLVSKIKPCMSMYKLLYGETANGSLKQL
jgi:hypothetical protein